MSLKFTYCKACNKKIINRQANASYCKECATPKMRLSRARLKPEFYEKKRQWAKDHRKLLAKYSKDVQIKNKEIIRLLRLKYNVKLYDDIIKNLKEDMENDYKKM